MRKRILMCGGRKRPQNSKVGAESAPKMSKWGQKVPPQFGHDKIRTEVKIKVGAESAPKITNWGQKILLGMKFNNVSMCQYANVPITIRINSAANWHIGILAHWQII